MEASLIPAVTSVLTKVSEFKDNFYTWFVENHLSDSDLTEIMTTFKSGDMSKMSSKDAQSIVTMFRNHAIADYMIKTLRVHAFAHNEMDLPVPSNASLTLDDINSLQNFKKGKLLRVNTGTWENLQKGWVTLTADYYVVYKSMAHYLFHGYLNPDGNSFAAFIIVKWADGLREVFDDPNKKHVVWQNLTSPEIFACMRYDDIIRLHPEFVIAYDVKYWLDKKVKLDLGGREAM
jgi:hypothetical protein